ncbi:MAG: superoxide dismutase [Puniceicoccales bacterium]|jgi:Fe-Mn family superoxide dismutase|nr:superoxide dismutase [Puniceicoccales bacterium]
MNYELPALPYSYDALEPYVDAKTMELHHSKHHAAYVNNLNNLLASAGYTAPKSVEKFLAEILELPAEFRESAKFNGGGHHNHSMFWHTISPVNSGAPTGNFLAATGESFGTFQDFKSNFEKSAMSHLGSGWTWLCVDRSRKNHSDHLFICSTLNHGSPNMGDYAERPGIPILTLDLWEHAYYLKYNNRKADYVKDFWAVVNWNNVAERYELAIG